MACGCGKVRKNKIVRVKVAEKKRMAVRIRDTAAYRSKKIERKKIIEKKLKSCKSCPHSTPTREERRKKIRICHKSNTSIQGIINSQKFKCPIGKF